MQNRTKLGVKHPKIVCCWGSAPDPAGGAYFVFFYRRTWGHRIGEGLNRGAGATSQKRLRTIVQETCALLCNPAIKWQCCGVLTCILTNKTYWHKNTVESNSSIPIVQKISETSDGISGCISYQFRTKQNNENDLARIQLSQEHYTIQTL